MKGKDEQLKDKKLNKRKNKKKMSTKKKVLITIISVILVILIGAFGFYMYVRNTIFSGSSENAPEVTYEEQPGITNILLIGTDARKLDERARADSIIIGTIDNNNKKLKLTSIMRDTVVDVPGHGEEKINASLAIGGPELLMKTIEENFGLSLNKYVMVNFRGFESIIDSLGGIDVDVKDYEIKEINKFIGEGLKKDEKSKPIENPGMQKLDGQQALSYSRIRKVGNGDFERTERQRRVIDIVTQKLKDVSVLKYPSIMNDLLPYIKTNIEPLMILNYAYTVSKFENLHFEQLRIPPSELISKDVGSYKNLGWVLLVDREQCGKIMKDFIFNDKTPKNEDYDIKSWNSKLNEYLYGANINPNENTTNNRDNESYNNTNNNTQVTPKPNKPVTPKPEVKPVKPVKPEVKPEPEVKPDPEPPTSSDGDKGSPEITGEVEKGAA